eukprot:3545448-Karenia_brevis.AAC.1
MSACSMMSGFVSLTSAHAGKDPACMYNEEDVDGSVSLAERQQQMQLLLSKGFQGPRYLHLNP